MQANHSRRLFLGLGIAVPVLALATGCPMLNPKPTATTNPTPVPSPTPNYTNQSSDAYTGAITVGGKAIAGPTDIQIRYPAMNAGSNRYPAAPGTSTDANGFFEVSKTLVPTASASVQFIWPTASGATASATTTNFTDLYVTDPIANPTVGKDASTPGFTLDVGWVLNPSPAIAATASVASGVTFTFNTLKAPGAPVAAGPFEYQVFVREISSSPANPPLAWSSNWHSFTGTTGSFGPWNGNSGAVTDSPTSTALAGPCEWQIKWATQGDINTDGTINGAKAFGETVWMPLGLQ